MNLPRNVVINVLSWLLPLGVTLKVTPIIVYGLGIESYGIYALVMGFIAYSFYFAISRAIPVYIAEYRVTNQIEKVGEVISATLAINLFVGLFALLFFFIATDWLVMSVLNISPEFQRDARIAFYLAGCTVLFMMVSQVFSAIPMALHRFDIYSGITLVTTLLLQIGNVLLVLAEHDVVSLFIWNLILIALNCMVFWLIAKRLLPEVKITLSFPRALLWNIIKFSSGVVTYQVLANLLLIFERSWLIRTSGQESLTYYVVPMTVAICIHTFISSLAVVIFPLATEANAQQNKQRLKVIYTRSLKFLTVLIVFPVVALCVYSKPFLTVWMGADFAQHSAMALTLLSITFGLIAFGTVAWSLADGLGKPWFNALLVLSWLLIAAPLMIWLTPKINVVGSAYGRFFSTVLTIPIYTLLIERWIFGKCLWGFWGRIILFSGITGTVTGLIQHFLLLNVPVNWLTIGLITGLSGLLFCGSLWVTPYFDREEKAWLVSLIERRRRVIETF